MKVEVNVVRELDWDWKGGPGFQARSGDYTHRVTVDPTPGYGHDPELVQALAERLTERFPLDTHEGLVRFYLAHFEPEERTNGWADIGYIYRKDGEARPWTGTIVLAGKRIPPHPAMTRYLVNHEYGHLVERQIGNALGKKDGDRLAGDYCKEVRGITEWPTYYGPGTWHQSSGEIFANDFLIVVMGAETEFWPHTCVHPLDPTDPVAQKVRDWWQNALQYRHQAAA